MYGGGGVARRLGTLAASRLIVRMSGHASVWRLRVGEMMCSVVLAEGRWRASGGELVASGVI